VHRSAALFGKSVVVDIESGGGEVLAAGFLVGVGSRYAGGCTSDRGGAAFRAARSARWSPL
jgi:uncharacterized membrane protein YedE/YeeE